MTKRSVIRITKNLQGLAVSEEQRDKFVKNDASVIKKPSISKPLFLIPVSGFRSLRKHPFLLALRHVLSDEERGETDVFAG